MTRGPAKAQAREKAQKKAGQQKVKHDQKAEAQKALTVSCQICRAQMTDNKCYKMHFASKHPKVPMPTELVNIEA